MAQQHRKNILQVGKNAPVTWRKRLGAAGSLIAKDQGVCREEFEAWARGEGVPTTWFERDSAGDYIWGYMPQWWSLWKRRHCPEEEAKAFNNPSSGSRAQMRRFIRYMGDHHLRHHAPVPK